MKVQVLTELCDRRSKKCFDFSDLYAIHSVKDSAYSAYVGGGGGGVDWGGGGGGSD